MPKKTSAGILIYRYKNGIHEVLLAHPGGPFWSNKDSWSIPKGVSEPGEELLAAAQREFKEETGLKIEQTGFVFLGAEKQGSSKINHIWALESSPDLTKFFCRSFRQVEWPPKSGNIEEFPEVDRINWFSLQTARKKIFKYQAAFIDKLAKILGGNTKQPNQPEQTSLL